MDCWGPAYESAAGVKAIEKELERLSGDYPRVLARFNELNAENLAK
jgi:hypothetical protein